MHRPSLQPLKGLRNVKGKEPFEDFQEVQDDHEQPMSPISRLFHEPGSNMYIIGDMGMKTRVDPDVFKAIVVRIIEKNHRFSCLQIPDKNGIMTWVPTHVNPDNHIIVPELDQIMESPDKFVEDYISNLSRSRVKNSIPLWDIHILNIKTSDAHGRCVFRFHHSLGDGTSLMTLLLSFCRKASDLEALPTFPGQKVVGRHIKVNTFTSMFTILWNSIVAFVMFFLTILFLKDTKTPLQGSPGAEDRPRRFVHKSVNLDDIKMVKNAMDVTVNDVVIGVIEAGLYRYLHRRYEEKNSSVPENIRLRAFVPFNMRSSSMIDALSNTGKRAELGIKTGSVLFPLSIKRRDDPLDYIREAKKTMDRKKASLEPLLKWFLAKTIIKLFGYKLAGKLNKKVYSSVTLFLSNIPGPQEELSLLGHEVAYFAPSVYGQPGALSIMVISYVDKMKFVLSVDEETIPDPQNLCDDFQQSFHLIKTSVLAGGCVKK